MTILPVVLLLGGGIYLLNIYSIIRMPIFHFCPLLEFKIWQINFFGPPYLIVDSTKHTSRSKVNSDRDSQVISDRRGCHHHSGQSSILMIDDVEFPLLPCSFLGQKRTLFINGHLKNCPVCVKLLFFYIQYIAHLGVYIPAKLSLEAH